MSGWPPHLITCTCGLLHVDPLPRRGRTKSPNELMCPANNYKLTRSVPSNLASILFSNYGNQGLNGGVWSSDFCVWYSLNGYNNVLLVLQDPGCHRRISERIGWVDNVTCRRTWAMGIWWPVSGLPSRLSRLCDVSVSIKEQYEIWYTE